MLSLLPKVKAYCRTLDSGYLKSFLENASNNSEHKLPKQLASNLKRGAEM